MFTGIIRDIGRVMRIEPKSGATLFEISTHLDVAGFEIGASVAFSGICLTLIEMTGNSFIVQVSNETVERTTIGEWEVGTYVNIEPSLRMGDELGGHMVLGHVDGVASLDKIIPDGDSHRMIITVPQELAPFIATKGSVSLDGISLTVNMVDGVRFSVNIIPHTLKVTTLGQAKAGQRLNVEIDPLARYIARRMEFAVPATQSEAA